MHSVYLVLLGWLKPGKVTSVGWKECVQNIGGEVLDGALLED